MLLPFFKQATPRRGIVRSGIKYKRKGVGRKRKEGTRVRSKKTRFVFLALLHNNILEG